MKNNAWSGAYHQWRSMDTASREEITNGAYELLMEKNNMPKYAKGGMTEHGLKVGDTIISKGRKGNEIVGVNRDEHELFTTDLDKGKRDVQGMYFKKGGDVMPFEKYEAIHEEIHENKYNKGGSVSNAVDKHIATRNACLKHGATLDAYKMAHKQYAKGGKIGDSGIIQDPNSLYNGKMGTIVGDDGGFFLVKTTQGTGLVKKTRIRIIEDDYAQGGSLKKKDEYAQGGNITNELNYLWRWSGSLTVNEIIEIIDALIDAGITDEDLKIKTPKKLGGSRYRELKDKKALQIWQKAKPFYKGNLEGNMYFQVVTDLIHLSMQGKTILEDWKINPIYSGVNQNARMEKQFKFNDDWRFADGGKINSAYGDMVFTKLANVESAYRSMTKPENYTILIKKDKSNYLVTTNKRAKMFTDEYEIYGYGSKNGIYKSR
jgi:hypothetical protein